MRNPHTTGFTLATSDIKSVAALWRLYVGGKPAVDPDRAMQSEVTVTAKSLVSAGEINQATWAAAVSRDIRHNRTGRVGLLTHGLMTHIQRLEAL
jgi:hypothetical protein